VSEDDDIDRRVAKHGWTAISVDDHEPQFTYTCGLLTRSQHPELIVVGLAGKTAYRVLAAVIERIQRGERFTAAAQLQILEGLAVAIRPVHVSQHELYFGYAMAHARRHDAPLHAAQVLWPDQAGYFPFDRECDSDVRAVQPRLDVAADPTELRSFRRRFGGR
jgi:hypothetical protein